MFIRSNKFKISATAAALIALFSVSSLQSIGNTDYDKDSPNYFIYLDLGGSTTEAEFIAASIPASIACYFRSVGDASYQNKFLSDGAAYYNNFDQQKCESDAGILSALPKNPNDPPKVIAQATRGSASEPIVYRLWGAIAGTDSKDRTDPYYAQPTEPFTAVMKLFPNGSGEFGKMQLKTQDDSLYINLSENDASVMFLDNSTTNLVFLRALVSSGRLPNGTSRYYVGRYTQTGGTNSDIIFSTDKQSNVIVRSDPQLSMPKCYKLGTNRASIDSGSTGIEFLMYDASTGERIKNMNAYANALLTGGSSPYTISSGEGILRQDQNGTLVDGATYTVTVNGIPRSVKLKAYGKQKVLPSFNASTDSECSPLLNFLTQNAATLTVAAPPAADWSSAVDWPSQTPPANPRPL
jgi:hypothetical protein